MNFFGHYHDHYENYSDVTEKRQIIDLEGIFSPTDKRKTERTCKTKFITTLWILDRAKALIRVGLPTSIKCSIFIFMQYLS